MGNGDLLKEGDGVQIVAVQAHRHDYDAPWGSDEARVEDMPGRLQPTWERVPGTPRPGGKE